MKTASATYKMVRALVNSWYEWRIIQGENVYGLDKLRSLKVYSALTAGSGIDIGNANSTECDITLVEQSANWPRMASFTVQFRICLGASGTKSEWITLGKYYTDERSEDKYGNLSIVAFDAMLKMEQSWTDKIPDELASASYPITARAWATIIQAIGVATFDDLTQLDNEIEFIGLNTTTTVRDVLKTIAAVHGSNWVMTDVEKLKLIPFENVTSEQTSKYIDLGLSSQSFEDSPALGAVSGVHLETEAGTVMEAGDESTYVVNAIVDVSNTTGIAEFCLDNLEDYVYKPFEAGTAYFDPIAEVGDSVKFDGVIYQIMTIDWSLGKSPVANLSAPYDKEIDHEYMVVSPEAKTYRKAMSLVEDKMGDYVAWSEFSTAIEQSETQISLIAESTCVTQTDFDTEISRLQNQIDGSIQSWSGNVVPTLSNAPAIDWTTAQDKAEHVGDMYFVNSDAGIPEAGNYYRFEESNGTYSWQLLNDSALTEALTAAQAAQAAAESAQSTANTANATAQLKGQIFITQPTPPYNQGDLWFDSVNSDIKVCTRNGGRQSGSFVSSDWKKRDKYTDDSALNQFLTSYEATITEIQNQVDKKAETYYQSTDPVVEWGGCVAGIAIAGIDKVGISPAIGNQHTGDLWYRTTDNTTWHWNGTSWEQQDVPEELFDKIDGKANVFVSQPTDEDAYTVGDLWVNATYGDLYSNDVLRCITPKDEGEDFNISHWIKASKYTDNTALEEFKSEFTVQPNQIKAEVEKRVIIDQSETMSSFGWVMSEQSHTWYSNADEVMKVNASGLSVKGQITATSGYIGGSSGFRITATAIRNGMTSRDDTTHNGVYIGTNGIALGAGKFKVTSGGEITATSGAIGGFNLTSSSIWNGMESFDDEDHYGVYIGTDGIAIGRGDFRVTSSGELYANNGYFLGLVKAGSIMSDYTDPGYNFGTFNGGGITEYSVSGGVGGQIGYANNGGIIGANLEYSTVETAQVSSGINTSLGYANFADGVFNARNTAGYVKTNAIIDGEGRTFYSNLLAYKNHQGTNMYARVWISTSDT